MIIETSKDWQNLFVKNRILVFCVIPVGLLYMFWNFISYVEMHKYVTNYPKHQEIMVSIILFEVVCIALINIAEFEINQI